MAILVLPSSDDEPSATWPRALKTLANDALRAVVDRLWLQQRALAEAILAKEEAELETDALSAKLEEADIKEETLRSRLHSRLHTVSNTCEDLEEANRVAEKRKHEAEASRSRPKERVKKFSERAKHLAALRSDSSV